MPAVGKVGAARPELDLIDVEPEASAAIWASAVHAPWPMSSALVSTKAVPSARSTARASRLEHAGSGTRRRAHAPADQEAVLRRASVAAQADARTSRNAWHPSA